MNQDMHTWIATLLVTIVFLIRHSDRYFIDSEDELANIIFPIQIVMPLSVFAIWLFIIV